MSKTEEEKEGEEEEENNDEWDASPVAAIRRSWGLPPIKYGGE